MGIFKKNHSGLNVFSSFRSTEHSERLRSTFEETQTFKRQLRKAEAALKVYEKATEEVLKVTDDSMTAFPRVWRKDDNVATSPNAAVLPEEDMAKPAPTTKKLMSYPSHKFQLTMNQRLQDEVYTPIDMWHKQYQHQKTRIEAVEGTRIEYDAARKDLGLAREASAKHARKTDGKSDPTLIAHETRAEAVLATKRQAYIQLEEEVHVELLELAADAQKMLHVVQRALLLVAEALADSAELHRERESQMPIICRESSGPLQLGVGNSVAGSPLASPVGTPTYASGSPANSFRNMTINETGTGTPTRFGAQSNRFDESAALAEEQRRAAPVPAGVAGIGPATGQTGHLKVTDEVYPEAPSHTVGGVQESTEFPTAPVHRVNPGAATGDSFGQKREAFLEQH